jgi:hypothetical protein
MTYSAARSAKIRGLHLAAHATAALAREALAAGDIPAYLNESRHAAQLYEDARISAGELEPLRDRTERVLYKAWLQEWHFNAELRGNLFDMRMDAIEAARQALIGLYRADPVQPISSRPLPSYLDQSLYQEDRAYHAPANDL